MVEFRNGPGPRTFSIVRLHETQYEAPVVRTASIWQARQPVYKTRVERWQRYEPWLGELRRLMPGKSVAKP